MRIQVNGASREIAAGSTVMEVLSLLKLEPIRVAVELNENLVRRATFGDTVLHEGDCVEIVTFVGGG